MGPFHPLVSSSKGKGRKWHVDDVVVKLGKSEDDVQKVRTRGWWGAMFLAMLIRKHALTTVWKFNILCLA